MTADLYHAALVARARSRLGAGRLEPADRSARLDNPFCGDRVTIDLRLSGGSVTAIGHEVRGCLLCEAAAAVIAELAPGRTSAELGSLVGGVGAMMRDGAPAPVPELEIFTPVQQVKSRRDCVLLPFSALAKALGQP